MMDDFGPVCSVIDTREHFFGGFGAKGLAVGAKYSIRPHESFVTNCVPSTIRTRSRRDHGTSRVAMLIVITPGVVAFAVGSAAFAGTLSSSYPT